MAKHSRQQFQDAFEWTACWASSGADRLDPDQSNQARWILGDNAYWVLVDSAHEWNRRNTAVSHG